MANILLVGSPPPGQCDRAAKVYPTHNVHVDTHGRGNFSAKLHYQSRMAFNQNPQFIDDINSER